LTRPIGKHIIRINPSRQVRINTNDTLPAYTY